MMTVAILAAASLALAGHPETETTAAAEASVAEQVALWNRGDLEGALQTYCPAADISWVNHAGLSHGYERFARSMREEFGREPGAMGTLAVDLLESRDLGGGRSLVVVRWSITRGGARLMGGISTQLWADCAGRTRIVFEHAS
jgi:hypothetical protein